MAITTTHPFLAACRREQTSYTPVWLMRQAGRYMEEYRKLRAQHEFLDLCKNSDLAAEITVTPVQRLGSGCGDPVRRHPAYCSSPWAWDLEYTKGDGPVIHHPRSAAATDVEQLLEFEPQEALPFVFEAVHESSRRPERQSAADWLCRRAVYPCFLSHRGRQLAQLSSKRSGLSIRIPAPGAA